jgi:hypothetical protein
MSLRIAALLASIPLTAATLPLHAQVEGGVQGSVNTNVRENAATIGVGGRVGAALFHTGDVVWKVDANFDYFFAGCPLEGVGCFAWHAHANILGTRKLGQPVLGYAGFGGAWQRSRYFSTEGGDLNAMQDVGGVNVIVGAQLPNLSAARPFFEARFAVFHGASNQLIFSLGALFSTAGQPLDP